MIPHLSDLIDFVRFLEELKTPKRHFEINCPLADPVRNPHLVLGTVRHVAISAKKKDLKMQCYAVLRFTIKFNLVAAASKFLNSCYISSCTHVGF